MTKGREWEIGGNRCPVIGGSSEERKEGHERFRETSDSDLKRRRTEGEEDDDDDESAIEMVLFEDKVGHKAIQLDIHLSTSFDESNFPTTKKKKPTYASFVGKLHNHWHEGTLFPSGKIIPLRCTLDDSWVQF